MPDNNNNQNRSNSDNLQDDMIFLPESPETPAFGPPAGVDEPAAPVEDPDEGLPTPELPSAPGSPGTSGSPNGPVRPVLPNGPVIPGNGQRPPIAVYPVPIKIGRAHV